LRKKLSIVSLLILRPDSIGFKCLSSKCTDGTFVKLLHLLHEKTERWPSMPIWEDNIDDLDRRWGDAAPDDLSERHIGGGVLMSEYLAMSSEARDQHFLELIGA
jgi:hypothetical protein